MKFGIIAAVLLLLGIGYYFVSTPDAVDPAETLPVNTEQEAAPAVLEESVEEPGDTPSADPSDPVKDLPEDVEASSKQFDLVGFNFGYDVTEIRVKEGDLVTIDLTVSDGFHDVVIDEFSAATEKIKEGGATSMSFVADKKGTYEFYCSVGQHRAQGMVGTLIVE